ncbi:YcfL family protein [Vibrio mytili]|uniref:YcfL protein: an outer membrane lipoprotein that is part of a salvage cluster n=1 Tax=Vibrio mytili TaxID=50718 RepID=A0A0C3E6B2_9VIBR|nr:YcfL family protein [Vibrio mytili]KIN09928.1 YcfL protein: an outer membrane lipoprotein that is part of a salvage cluster [Vibrio mytili]
MRAWLIGLMVIIGLAGCAANTAGVRIDGQTQQVFFNDDVLGSRLVVDNVSTTYVDDRARGVVQLSSQYKGDQQILYRFYWYDNTGLEVNTKPGPWRKMIVRGYESAILSEVTVNPNGTRFRVQIREATDN